MEELCEQLNKAQMELKTREEELQVNAVRCEGTCAFQWFGSLWLTVCWLMVHWLAVLWVAVHCLQCTDNRRLHSWNWCTQCSKLSMSKSTIVHLCNSIV